MFMELCCSVTNVFFVLVYMEVVPEPNIVGECIKCFLMILNGLSIPYLHGQFGRK